MFVKMLKVYQFIKKFIGHGLSDVIGMNYGKIKRLYVTDIGRKGLRCHLSY